VKGVTFRGGRWQVRKQVKGRRVALSFTVKTDALEYLRNLERQDAGLPALQRPVSLEEGRKIYEDGLHQRGAPETTLRFYAAKFAVLERLFGAAGRLDRITEGDVGAYVEARRGEGVQNKTIKEELALLHRTTRRSGITPAWHKPALRVTYHPRRAPSPDEVAALWRELNGPPRVALALCLLTGMRASEAMRATVADCDLKAKTIRLTDRKTPDPVYVAIVPTLNGLLPKAGRLVGASADAVRSAMVRASKRAGTPATWYGPGLGRHSFASWAVQFGGFTTAQVADALGHRLPGVATPLYIHAQAVEPVRRPMSLKVESVLLKALEKSGTKRHERGRGVW